MVDVPTVKKFKDVYARLDTVHERGGHPDRQTAPRQTDRQTRTTA